MVIKIRLGPKQIQNMVLNSWKWYYIVYMYKYYQLTIFLILIWNFDQSQTFSPGWSELGLIRADRAKTGRKLGFQESSVVLHRFYIQLTTS